MEEIFMTDHDVAIKRLKGKLKKNWRDWLFVALLFLVIRQF